MSIDPNLIIYAPLVLMAIVIIWLIRMEFKLHKFLKGRSASSLEELIHEVNAGLKESREFEDEMEKYLLSVETRLRNSAQGVGTVRFNAFRGTGEGGNQSFATAFLNEHGDGVVISSMYSRDRVSVFSKPIAKFKSEYELSKEEKEAVIKAKAQLPRSV